MLEIFFVVGVIALACGILVGFFAAVRKVYKALTEDVRP